jgi:manganese efflux pump family protein
MGLAMDCFSVSISNSSISGLVKSGIPLKTSLLFSTLHVVMIWLGFMLGNLISSFMAGLQIWVAFLILVSIGSKMVLEAVKRRPEAKVFDINNIRVILALSFATSMDAFLVGVVMAMILAPMGLMTLLIALLVFIFTLSGMAGGSRLGFSFARTTMIIGGAFMIMASLWFLMQIWS